MSFSIVKMVVLCCRINDAHLFLGVEESSVGMPAERRASYHIGGCVQQRELLPDPLERDPLEDPRRPSGILDSDLCHYLAHTEVPSHWSGLIPAVHSLFGEGNRHSFTLYCLMDFYFLYLGWHIG